MGAQHTNTAESFDVIFVSESVKDEFGAAGALAIDYAQFDCRIHKF